ncbi:lytic transglycosylase, catalytic [Luminiphilus syltensis NOR5-1B]|uniref:Lytic transglycosylase, catalytic n=1 Tax=Luminiphilus syltensis NOR5-1B TaxID=565045 RepID=B8KTN2_9GAMM|nr:lytic transglycosylase F [Luminiphilus syltensis]EED35658.1 lytic transglycosylase, catalytic [Luminiphilus syltensis NOR5-1B]
MKSSAIGLMFLLLLSCADDGGAPAMASAPPATEESAVALEIENLEAEGLTEVEPKPASSGQPTALELTTVRTGDIDTLVEARVIRVLTVYGPGRYYLDDGPQGTVVEIAKRLEKVVNEAYDTGLLKVYVVPIPVSRAQLFSALIEGRGDIVIAGTTITEARNARVDFTIPASKPISEILVTGPSAPIIEKLDDLAGKTLFLRPSSSYHSSALRLSRKLVERGLEPIAIEPLSELLEDEDVIEMVNAGLLPWTIVDDYKPLMWKGVFDDIAVRNDLVFREGARLGWALRQNSPELQRFLNTFLEDNRQGTLFGNILYNRYVRDFDWAENALRDEELARYLELADHFQRHGGQYGIDPNLLAAQGFQESKLRQEARSHAGAIGVMQLLKSTARDKNVNIPNIEQVDPNIEAGAKYMAFLRERYFSGEKIDPLDSSLLALAAYNAGPAKVRRMRRIAEERGYDPNRWFDNVEVIAAEIIGRETVQYVANIYKYYVAYVMIERQNALKESARESAGITN